MEEWERRRLNATVQTAALCAYVDGHLAEEERARMCECIATFASSEAEAKQLLKYARELPEWVGSPPSGFRNAQYAEIKAGLRTRAEREAAFHLATQVAAAHGGLGLRETSFLLDLMFQLEIEGDNAKQYLEEARLKGREQ